MWWPWRRPTREQLYRWIVAEYGRDADAATTSNLAVLVKMDYLLKRIETERALLQKDIEEAERRRIPIDWLQSQTVEVMNDGFRWKLTHTRDTENLARLPKRDRERYPFRGDWV